MRLRLYLALSTAFASEDRWGDIASGKEVRQEAWSSYPAVKDYIASLQRRKSGGAYGNWRAKDHKYPPVIQEVMCRYFYGKTYEEYQRMRPRTKHIPTLSVGGGWAWLEMGLVMEGLTSAMTVSDFSPGSIDIGRKSAPEETRGKMKFVVSNSNTDIIEGKYAFIFCHHSLHHIDNLEFFLEQVHGALLEGGIFAFADFVGPTRYQWTPQQQYIQKLVIQALPEQLRRNGLEALQQAQAGSHVHPHAIQRMHAHTHTEMISQDPSESVRSAEIMPVLEKWFATKLPVIEQVPLGGTILHPMLDVIGFSWNQSDDKQVALMKMMCVVDELAIDLLGQSDFTLVVTQKDGDENLDMTQPSRRPPTNARQAHQTVLRGGPQRFSSPYAKNLTLP